MKTFRSKGLNYEIEISKKLSKWITGGKKDRVLWRSMSSGGLFTKNIVNIDGDICSVENESIEFCKFFVVECKRRSKVNIMSFLYSKDKSDMIQFWNQVIEASKKSNKIPLLIMRENYKEDLIAMPFSFFQRLNIEVEYIMVDGNNMNFIVCTLNDFFRKVEYSQMICVAKEHVSAK